MSDQVVYHAFQSHFPSVIGTIYSCNAVLMQCFGFLRQDGATTATKNFDVAAPALIKQIFNVFEEFHMTTLVTGKGNALHVFLNSTFHNFVRRAVVPQMNDFSAFALQYPPHDVYGRIMAVE